MKIITNFDPKPIPPRQFDWSATWDNYEPGHGIGFGATEQEAIRNLIDNYPSEECLKVGGLVEWQPYQRRGLTAFHALLIAIVLGAAFAGVMQTQTVVGW